MKTCSDCKFAVFQDEGYLNWTVEGTQFECRQKVHPDGDFDRYYGEDERLNFADKCEKFEAGDSIEMDVDRDNYNDLSDEQKNIFDLK